MAQTNNDSGVGFFTVLGLIFLTLKLIGIINWSWWLVLLPFYGGITIALLFILLIYLLER